MNQKFDPSKINGLFQLNASVLLALVSSISAFLYAATKMEGSFEGRTLVLASIIILPAVVFSVLFISIRYRHLFLDDKNYINYLSKNEGQRMRLSAEMLSSPPFRPVLPAQGIDADTRPITDPGSAVWDDTWKIAVNVFMPDYDNIIRTMARSKIKVIDVFGRSDNIPQEWVISISTHIPMRQCYTLLRLLAEFNFHGVNFWSPVRSAGESEDVYLGSYVEGPIVRIDGRLKEALTGNQDFYNFTSEMQKRRKN